MPRFSYKRYNLYVLLLMAVYIAVLFWLWPLARGAGETWWKILLAISPVLPVAAVIALMAHRVLASDELQRRLHLMALGIATATVGTLSLVGGFLAAAKVWSVGGDVLIWVFPALCLVYGVSRMALSRWYTGAWGVRGCE
ncbi:MAG TPA: hypothetical protein VFJ87_10240 [Rhodanobacteraceae bacterium]|jgi:hypothetical protein|nr:hypothetical protein [Rhodanobacteraceae bacterium]